ncbi:MAG TPA: hypothetical protein VF723_02630 [Pyrinomonadaceae bacterium]|jgi:hypothetical protein
MLTSDLHKLIPVRLLIPLLFLTGPLVAHPQKLQFVTVHEQDNIAAVEVLDAPDPLIGQAVTNAVNKWKLNPPTLQGKAVPIRES